MNVIDAAYIIHVQTCEPWRGVALSEWVADGDPRIAAPFGRPLAMPDHRWIVSWDVMQALTDAAPPPIPVPNPKTAHGFTKMLFGWPVSVLRDAPPGTMLLELSAVGFAVEGPESGGDERIRTAE